MVVEEQIPESLEQPVEAALAWFNAREEEVFQVTGMVEPDRAPASKAPRTLRLILCAGDRCEQRSFRVSKQGSVFDVEMIEGLPRLGAGCPSHGSILRRGRA